MSLAKFRGTLFSRKGVCLFVAMCYGWILVKHVTLEYTLYKRKREFVELDANPKESNMILVEKNVKR